MNVTMVSSVILAFTSFKTSLAAGETATGAAVVTPASSAARQSIGCHTMLEPASTARNREKRQTFIRTTGFTAHSLAYKARVSNGVGTPRTLLPPIRRGGQNEFLSIREAPGCLAPSKLRGVKNDRSIRSPRLRRSQGVPRVPARGLEIGHFPQRNPKGIRSQIHGGTVPLPTSKNGQTPGRSWTQYHLNPPGNRLTMTFLVFVIASMPCLPSSLPTPLAPKPP